MKWNSFKFNIKVIIAHFEFLILRIINDHGRAANAVQSSVPKPASQNVVIPPLASDYFSRTVLTTILPVLLPFCTNDTPQIAHFTEPKMGGTSIPVLYAMSKPTE